MIQATTKDSIRIAVSRFGVAPGAQSMLNLEKEASLLSLSTGLYITWRLPSSPNDCTRVGPGAKCFCGHLFDTHNLCKRSNPCTGCRCISFKFIPQRPEEVGEWWLPRRKEFDIRTYRVKCRCRHSHEEHDPVGMNCRTCTCFGFSSNFLCLVCDKHWEEHETVYENEAERRRQGRTFGEAYMPLAGDRDLQEAVFRPQPRTYVRKAHNNKPKSLGPTVRKKQKIATVR